MWCVACYDNFAKKFHFVGVKVSSYEFPFCQNVVLNVTENHLNMHENQRVISHVFFSANIVLKKLYIYKNFANSIEIR